MLCGQCKHWDISGDTEVADLPVGAGQCSLISSSAFSQGVLARTAYGYDLFTKPTFGCILGEK